MIAERRLAAGLTQVELATRLGRPQSFVSKYETGERRLDVVEFLEIAEALSFDPAELLRSLMNTPA
ncbi:helix-turn-helix domain-containing protein [Falsiroseomonas sp. HC035]|uniref:helix-turn-helix domain-containing protein n=1 Tax=Falsiroseomonas sp. HC035 TaxID=3390999 RepID=UPI003D3168B1